MMLTIDDRATVRKRFCLRWKDPELIILTIPSSISSERIGRGIVTALEGRRAEQTKMSIVVAEKVDPHKRWVIFHHMLYSGPVKSDVSVISKFWVDECSGDCDRFSQAGHR